MSFIVDKYTEQTKRIMEILTRNIDINNDELNDFIVEEAENNLKRTPCILYNNYNNKRSQTDMVKLLDWYDKKKPIPCEHGCFFKRHDQAINLNAAFVNSFLVQRKKDKKMMFECEKAGDAQGVKYYNTRQKVQKIFANSYYGVQGQSSSVFYNIFTALSVTGKGQSVISCACTTFERFLCNNIKFRNMDDCLFFISNVVNEERKYNDSEVLDRNITKKELMIYLATQFENRKDCVDNQDVLKLMIQNLTQEEVNRVFMKNNIYAFLINSKPFELIEKVLTNCDEFTNPNEVPETIKEYVDELWNLLEEYVYYDQPVYDRITWSKTAERKTVITIDTDSNFLNLEPLYDFVVENASFEIDKNDWTTAYKIISLFAYMLGKVIANAYATFTEHCNVPEEKRPIINMKNEFLLQRILLTSSKKNYASYVLLQEGVQLPDKKALDIKGLPLKKANVNRSTGEFLMGLLKNEILKSDTIQTKEVLQKLSEFENKIRQSFLNGETEYMSPGKVNEIESYKAPYTIASVRAALVWNALYPEKEMNFPAQLSMVKVKADTLDKIAFLYEDYPDIYRTLKEQVFEDENLSKYGMTYFGLPKTEDKIPDWVIPLIDIDTIIQDNLKNFLKILDSIGLRTIMTTADSEYFSNIIQF